jgi:sulfite exporter TauE/SafE
MKLHNIITLISLTAAAIINAATYNAKSWTGIGYMLIFGLFPLIALLLLLIISLFLLKISKSQKFFTVIGVGYSLVAIEIILGTRSPWISFLFPSAGWLLPLLVWNFLLQWFKRKPSGK